MLMLQDQAAATSVELNDKFRSDVDAFLEFGTRKLFDKGLNDWIGTLPHSTNLSRDLQRDLGSRYLVLTLTVQNFC